MDTISFDRLFMYRKKKLHKIDPCSKLKKTKKN